MTLYDAGEPGMGCVPAKELSKPVKYPGLKTRAFWADLCNLIKSSIPSTLFVTAQVLKIVRTFRSSSNFRALRRTTKEEPVNDDRFLFPFQSVSDSFQQVVVHFMM
jgi:hypothetical protein